MGIQGLLPFLKKASREVHLKDFKGCIAAVDVYCWLHKGAFSCADKLVRGEKTDGYVVYVMKLVNLLLSLDIKPVMVFDGCHLPSKAITETKRRENREKNRKKAKEFLREGKLREARECYQRCINITSDMAKDVIVACRAKGIDTIVAPYEADAQLAYLNRSGIAQLVLTEDSDLVLFGCDRMVFKLDSNGKGIMVEKEKLHVAMNMARDKFSFDKFRNMCILSGCDYLPSLHGIGLGKAAKFFSLTNNPDVYSALSKLPTYLNMPSLEVNVDYRNGFLRAVNTFLYQLVFDPRTRNLVPLSPYEEGKSHEDYPYAGEFIGHARALQVACGNVDVETGKLVDNFNLDASEPSAVKSSSWERSGVSKYPSIWSKDSESTPRPSYPAVPQLHSTFGKKTTMDIKPAKRKSVADENEDEGEDLEELYGISKKKLKSSGNQEQGLEEEVTSATHTEDDVHKNSDESSSSPAEKAGEDIQSQKSRNPFAKTKNTQSANNVAANKFSALRKFGFMTKTKINPDVITQSRYFASKSSVSISVSKSNEMDDTTGSVKKELETSGHLDSTNSSEGIKKETVTEEVTCSRIPLADNICNTNVDKPHSKSFAFKWTKSEEKVQQISCSPTSRKSFKPITSELSITREESQLKENASFDHSSTTLLHSDSTENLSASQSSHQSIISDVGSIDGESFGLTPDSMISSDQDSQESSAVMVKTAPSPGKKFQHVSHRGPGLSRRYGSKLKNQGGGKQLSLRDMFGFNRDVQKIKSSK
ncbi:exonuclease 1-like [Oratosquilla oratoria]|uniref:exonuclease 1-like n=1 Tax=Oratosquilla oratoria TaxID=337810 RepID=UPI003F7695E9